MEHLLLQKSKKNWELKMCKSGNTVLVKVKIPADLSHTGKAFWKDVAIDSCIASIIKALQEAGIDMRGSCCGHEKMDGDIHLQDGRILIIKRDGNKYLKLRKRLG